MRLVIWSSVAVTALVMLAAAPAQAAAPKLVGTVGPGFTITLKKGSAKVTKLAAGKYSITINDLSSSHDFHLVGPGVNMKTSVGGMGRTTWTVKLERGKSYRFMCDPHASFMKGSLKVV